MLSHHQKKILAHLASSLITSLVVLGVFGALVWWKRAEVFHYFATQFLAESTGTSGRDVQKETTKIITQEGLVIGTVKKADPAVFSIVITKDVPVVEQYFQQWNPFQDFFGGDFGGFQIPQYRQNGTKKQEVGGGTGFLVTKDGLALTNKHVVEDTAASYTALTNSGKKYVVEVVAKDPVLDLAVIRLKGIPPAGGFPFLSLGNSDTLDVGESVIAIGNALGEFRNTVSVGVVSGLARSITASDPSGNAETLDEVIQTDAAINPGNSGGPLLSLSGQVVGIDVAVAQGSQNIGFALPVNLAKASLASVEKYGRIVRPYLGIRYTEVTPAIQEKNKLTVDYGALIVRGANADELAVIPGSPADKAGLVEYDIILELDGVKVTSEHPLASLIRTKNVGDTVTLKILHKGEEKTVLLKLEEFK